MRCSENFGENLALEGAFVSPTSRRPLTWDAERAVFVAAGDAERFGCIADEVPDFRPDGCGLPADEIAGFRARLAELWKRSEAEPLPPQALVPASSADTRRYWRFVARGDMPAWTAHSLQWLDRVGTVFRPSLFRGGLYVRAAKDSGSVARQ